MLPVRECIPTLVNALFQRKWSPVVPLCLTLCIIPVSYTHLDVYKRQLTACWEAFDLSDVITFHNYTQPGSPDRYHNQSGGSLEFLPELERALSYGRPVLCTECLARSEGNTF